MEYCPTISLKSFPHGKDALADQFSDAFSNFGSALIVDHGIDLKLCRKVATDFQTFFNKPLEEKLIYNLAPKSAFRGYYPIGSTNSNTLMGRKGYPDDPLERWRFGPLEPQLPFADDASNFVLGWAPNLYADCFVDSCKEFQMAINNLTQQLFDIISVSMGQTEGYLRQLCKNSMNMLSVVNYPPVEPVNKEQDRISAHTDKTLFTIIMQDDTQDSFRVKSKTGQWVFINEPGPEHLVILVGEALNRLTNNHWAPTMHAVSYPIDLTTLKSRLSFQLLATLAPNSLMKCVPKFLDENGQSSFETMTYKEFTQKVLQKYLSLDSSAY